MRLPLPVLPSVIVFAAVLGAALALRAPARQDAREAREQERYERERRIERARRPRSKAPAASPMPTSAGGDAACADAAISYEKNWMRYSEDTKSPTLHRQLQSSKTRLCDCLAKNYGYEGVLPQPLRAFCEDREILTPLYFPSRRERPPTAAP